VENNLSLANMDWAESAGNVEDDGVFRGFWRPRRTITFRSQSIVEAAAIGVGSTRGRRSNRRSPR
jgi:hypothetical protein